MVKTNNLIKIKEYDRFVLFEHKYTGIKECILKSDLRKAKNEMKKHINKWERTDNLTNKY